MNDRSEEANGTIKLFFVLIAGAFFYEFVHFCITPWRGHDASPQWLIYNYFKKTEPDPIRFVLSIAILVTITLIVIYLLYWSWKCYIRNFNMSPQNLVFTFLFSAIPLSFKVLIDMILLTKIERESFGVEAKIFILMTLIVYLGIILYLEREDDLWKKNKFKIFTIIFLIFLLMIINNFLIRMFMIWSLIFFLGKIFYRILRKNRMFIVRTWNLRNWLYNNKKSISIFLVGLIVIWVYVSLFSIRGSETVKLDIDIKNRSDTELWCENIEEYFSREYHEFGYIRLEIRLKIKEIYNKDYIYSIRFCVKRNNYLFRESLQRSYMFCTVGDLTKLKIPLREEGGYYHFDIKLPKGWNEYIPDNELHFVMYIYVGEDLLSLNKEKITLHKTIRIDFDEKTTITSYFGNDWNIVYDKEIKDPKTVLNIIESKRDVHQLTTKVRKSSDESVTQEIKLERNLALFSTKLGVFLSVVFGGISLIISIYLHEKRNNR